MQIFSFVSANQYGRWSRALKRSIDNSFGFCHVDMLINNISVLNKNVFVFVLGPVQNFTCAESNAYKQNLLFLLISIRFGTGKVQRLNRALGDSCS